MIIDAANFMDSQKLVKPIISKKAPTKVTEIDQRKKGYKAGKDMVAAKAHIKIKKPSK